MIVFISGHALKIDPDDYHLIQYRKVHIRFNGDKSNLYAQFNNHTFLHRVILGLEKHNPLQCDHINGDSLDNRRANLRICTRQQNGWNRRIGSYNSTRLKGVYKHRKNYRAIICFNNKHYRLGTHKTPLLAAIAYNRAAKLLFGDFALLNIVDFDQKIIGGPPTHYL